MRKPIIELLRDDHGILSPPNRSSSPAQSGDQPRVLIPASDTVSIRVGGLSACGPPGAALARTIPISSHDATAASSRCLEYSVRALQRFRFFRKLRPRSREPLLPRDTLQ